MRCKRTTTTEKSIYVVKAKIMIDYKQKDRDLK